jgi:putative heme-binding domain-containing protein
MSLAQSAGDPGAAKNPLSGKAEAIETGQKLFREGCAACHGANAEGGRGPNLNENRDLRRMTDAQLFATIRHGIPGTEMPASPLPDNSVWELAAFVRSLSAPAYLMPLRGDAKAGADLFFGKAQCSNCHMVQGRGGYIGPDLTNVAEQSTNRQLRESILQPNVRIDPAFIGVVVKLKNGTRLEGVAKNHSNYSLQLLDANGKLHLLNTEELQNI